MKKYTEEEMRQRYEQWQHSGMTRVAFAQEQGITPHTFYYWTNKFDKAAANQDVGFQSIAVEGPQMIGTGIPSAILHFPSGVVMELPGPVDVELLQSLVR